MVYVNLFRKELYHFSFVGIQKFIAVEISGQHCVLKTPSPRWSPPDLCFHTTHTVVALLEAIAS
jgi:hypothetical protein